jgi:two-component system, NtrC family, response regulator AtoC
MLAQTLPSLDSAAETCPVAARDFPLRVRKSPAPRVLVVDDEPLVRWSVAETLGARGYQVHEAGSGASAIRALMGPPGTTDVVLLDLLLPDYCDLSLLAVLRGVAPTVPIIMMTAFATPGLVERARKLGALTVINKPFDMNELAPLIRQALLAARPS